MRINRIVTLLLVTAVLACPLAVSVSDECDAMTLEFKNYDSTLSPNGIGQITISSDSILAQNPCYMDLEGFKFRGSSHGGNTLELNQEPMFDGSVLGKGTYSGKIMDQFSDKVYATIGFTVYGLKLVDEGNSFTEDKFVGGTFTLPVKDDVTGEDKTFLGWSESDGGPVKYGPGADYTAVSDMTLYAVWMEKGSEPLSISVTGDYRTEYTCGDRLDLTGIKVIATYADGTTGDVTFSCIFSPMELTQVGKVLVKAEYGSLSDSFEVTVSEASVPLPDNGGDKGGYDLILPIVLCIALLFVGVFGIMYIRRRRD